jgi:hypothetical protein
LEKRPFFTHEYKSHNIQPDASPHPPPPHFKKQPTVYEDTSDGWDESVKKLQQKLIENQNHVFYNNLVSSSSCFAFRAKKAVKNISEEQKKARRKVCREEE